MAQRGPAPEPLLVILGSTGTGKSDLAVELATRFNGEIINADAMQMYKGLPIITNKISPAERRGIPHHLLDTIGLDTPPWTVTQFRHTARDLVREIRSRGRLPIVVGGTHYYTNGLLFDDALVEEGQKQDTEWLHDSAQRFPILDGPTDAMMAMLREVDPAMAERWHPNDRRKIRRSLQIYLETGKRASDIYAEQRLRRDGAIANDKTQLQQPWQSVLCWWIYARRDVLDVRLEDRVDAMVEHGLLDETTSMYAELRSQLASGAVVDRSTGIWQSIGFKEFEPYLRAATATPPPEGEAADVDEDELERLRRVGIVDTKTATRRYAKSQVRWIVSKTIPKLRADGTLDKLYVLDSTDAARWEDHVVRPATGLTAAFLAGEPLPQPVELSETAREVLAAHVEGGSGASAQVQVACQRTCEPCGVTTVTEELWEQHVQGKRHRGMARRAKRMALVPADIDEDKARALQQKCAEV